MNLNTGPTVSVIIPVYNGANYLTRAIKSVLAQSYPIKEIIVIDDGSIDSTPSIMEKFKDVIIAKRIPNSGAGAARNTGLEMATGDYIAFLDHDDVWFEKKIEKQMAMAVRYPEIGLITCDFAVRYPFFKNRMLIHFSILNHPEAINYDEPLRENPFKVLVQEHFIGTTSAVLVKKELVAQVGMFNPEYKSSQDYDYWLRCATFTNFIVLKDVLFYKKNHSFNISQNVLRTHDFRKQILRNAMTQHNDFIRRHNLENTCMQAISDCQFYLGNVHFEAAHIFEAYKYYFRGFWTYPNLHNFRKFVWLMFKKTVRLLTFNLFSRKTLDKIGD